MKYIAGAPNLDQIPEKYGSHVTCMNFFFMLMKLRSMLTGFEGEMLPQQKSIRKFECSNASFAVGSIRISMRRKPKIIRRNAQLFGLFKIGNHKSSTL